MKTVIRSVSLFLLIFLASFSAFAQTPADILPTVQTTDLSRAVVLVGAGVHNGQASGFTNILVHATGPVYAALAEDVQGGKTSTRAGIETILYRHGGLFLSAKGNAGVATGATAIGGSYGVGGSVLYRLPKAPAYVFAFSGTWDYSNIADVGRDITSGKARQVFSGGTYRFAVGKVF
ncbi:hypothetical protein UFOVP130_58 [uncultured Caudovirales phage]|uniref:Uncharacterized protein n=1 Tax=uncultured Caudovirales phage TaxID=2100421 RepID=A0A6J5L8W5_9CAUD|nr:hypothetical protein UFOVP130_58 [uncultured Caudovirales phage]